jgi:dTDP-4-amino-4,6-dideoxygalactose transaminase
MLESSPPRIPANDFVRQWDDIQHDAIGALERVGRSGWLVLGEEVHRFEQEFAAWWGIPYAVGVASGLDALEIALRCANLPAGARVITTPLTAFATTLAIVRAGGEPVWCDVDESGGLNLDLVAAALRKDRTIRAIVPVHLYGHPLDPLEIERLADQYGVAVIEDCAQSAGAERDGRPTGTVGIASGTSLYPTKNLGAMGDGGVMLTSDAGIAEKARRLRDYGQSQRYEHTELGLNSRLDELQAAILRSASLPRLNRWLARRKEIALSYADALNATSLTPIVAGGGHSAHHLFPVEIKDEPTTTIERLLELGVTPGRHYPFVCPDQMAMGSLGVILDPLTQARRIAEREISLPIHPHLDDDQVDRVITACLEVADDTY